MGVPIAFALGLTTLFTAMIWARVPMTLIYQQLYQAVDNFVLLAIPLFMLAGDLMLRAGIIDDIIMLCNVLVGRLRGGLAHVNIVASMFFAGITGSAVSDTAAPGSVP
ncbi:MAG: TRAP transporter large permease subunit, partial [Rhodospirillaceae bacterium]|nr:TRAP transporter large permease subunit [Rhodospirillaceae bacterium]